MCSKQVSGRAKNGSSINKYADILTVTCLLMRAASFELRRKREGKEKLAEIKRWHEVRKAEGKKEKKRRVMVKG